MPSNIDLTLWQQSGAIPKSAATSPTNTPGVLEKLAQPAKAEIESLQSRADTTDTAVATLASNISGISAVANSAVHSGTIDGDGVITLTDYTGQPAATIQTTVGTVDDTARDAANDAAAAAASATTQAQNAYTTGTVITNGLRLTRGNGTFDEYDLTSAVDPGTVDPTARSWAQGSVITASETSTQIMLTRRDGTVVTLNKGTGGSTAAGFPWQQSGIWTTYEFGAIGDNDFHPVSEWLTGGAYASRVNGGAGFANLAAIQAVYPDVVSLSASGCDRAAFQKAINMCRDNGGGEVWIQPGMLVLEKPVYVPYAQQDMTVAQGSTGWKNPSQPGYMPKHVSLRGAGANQCGIRAKDDGSGFGASAADFTVDYANPKCLIDYDESTNPGTASSDRFTRDYGRRSRGYMADFALYGPGYFGSPGTSATTPGTYLCGLRWTTGVNLIRLQISRFYHAAYDSGGQRLAEYVLFDGWRGIGVDRNYANHGDTHFTKCTFGGSSAGCRAGIYAYSQAAHLGVSYRGCIWNAAYGWEKVTHTVTGVPDTAHANLLLLNADIDGGQFETIGNAAMMMTSGQGANQPTGNGLVKVKMRGCDLQKGTLAASLDYGTSSNILGFWTTYLIEEVVIEMMEDAGDINSVRYFGCDQIKDVTIYNANNFITNLGTKKISSSAAAKTDIRYKCAAWEIATLPVDPPTAPALG